MKEKIRDRCVGYYKIVYKILQSELVAFLISYGVMPIGPGRRAKGASSLLSSLHVRMLSEVFSHAVAQLHSVHLCKQLVVK